MVSGAEDVISHFGYWPEFADGTIIRFQFERAGTICLTIRYGDTMTKRAGVVCLRFTGVSVAELNELREQNVLDVLHISEGKPIEVLLEAAYGLNGTFTCESVAVVSFRGEMA